MKIREDGRNKYYGTFRNDGNTISPSGNVRRLRERFSNMRNWILMPKMGLYDPPACILMIIGTAPIMRKWQEWISGKSTESGFITARTAISSWRER